MEPIKENTDLTWFVKEFYGDWGYGGGTRYVKQLTQFSKLTVYLKEKEKYDHGYWVWEFKDPVTGSCSHGGLFLRAFGKRNIS